MTNNFNFENIIINESIILNSDSKATFDEITKMASMVCDVPMAFICVSDHKTHIIKSKYGITAKNIPMINLICNTAMSEGNNFFSEATLNQDPRFKTNSFTESFPDIVSCYCVLLKGGNESPIGTLCTLSDKQTTLTGMQGEFLSLLSKQIVRLLELEKIHTLIQESQAKVQSKTKKKEEFVSMAAHDLKSPIRNIKSFIELLKTRHESFWDAEDLEYFNFIEKSSHKMNDLIAALLEYSKADMGKLETTLIAVETKINDIFDNQIKLCEQPNAKLVLIGIKPITGIPIVIEIVFENLINNALKYQKACNSARIEIVQKENQKEYIFHVCDNGIGIDPKFKNVIFEPFKRLHNDRIYKGSGLGLATCSRMLKNIGGSISVAPNIESGSCFTVIIPK